MRLRRTGPRVGLSGADPKWGAAPDAGHSDTSTKLTASMEYGVMQQLDRNGQPTMNTAITRLDQMLYAWLAEREERKFERAFQKYYEVAFGGLVRYLARRAGSTDMDVEQLAVDALLKFFCKAGRDRRQASESIQGTLMHLEPLNLGDIHGRQVRAWAADVGDFRESAMHFAPPQEDSEERDWKSEIRSLAEAIPPLKRQGCQILNTVRSTVARIIDADARPAETAANADEDSSAEAQLAGFAERIRQEASAGSAEARAVDARHPGALRFIDGSWRVIEALPLLRVPTNGYLFEIAQSLYLDECKARGRQKRGGAAAAGHLVAAAAEPAGAHPVSRVDLDAETAESEVAYADHCVWTPKARAGEQPESADPISDRMGEEFCQQFHAYLCRPLQAAQEAYTSAAATGTANAERKRLESIARKTERVIAVLSMRIDGQSQQEIAASLGISRNQVKYIVQQVQQAYEQFAAASARTPLRPSFGALPHVQ